MKNDDQNEIATVAKLKWACRRGMLELDIILGQFLDNGYPWLPDEDKRLFVRLLDQSDPDLFAWLMGNAEPDDPTLQYIINKIRKHARA